MATEEIALKITTDASQTEKSVKSIRAELREAQQNAIALGRQFGELSPEALAAAQKVANLKDEVGDLKNRIDALNPDAKFRAFSTALQGVAGGFAGVQGAIGLFGTESEELERQLLKVQSALALSEGINSILEAKDSFLNLGAIIRTKVVAAFSTLKGAIIATGIGALAVLLGTIVAYWDEISEAIGGATKETKAYGEAQKEVNSEVEKAYENLIAVGNGFQAARDGAISKTEALALYNDKLGATIGKAETLEQAERLYKANSANYIKAITARATAQVLLAKAATAAAKAATGEDADLGWWDTAVVAVANAVGGIGLASEEVVKRASKNRQKNQDEINLYQGLALTELEKAGAAEAEMQKVAVKNGTSIVRAGVKAQTAAKKEGITQQANDRKVEMTQEEKDAQAKKELFEKNKKELQDLNTETAEENRLARLSDFERDIEQLTTEYNEKLAKAKEFNVGIEAITEEYKRKKEEREKEQDIIDLEKSIENDAAKIAKTQGDFENDLAVLDAQRQMILSNTALTEEQRTKLLDENAKARVEITKAEFDARMALMDALGQGMNTLSDLVGKETAAGKGFAVAASLISTYSAIAGQLSAFSKVPIPGYAIAQAIATGLAGFAAVRNILKVKVPGGAPAPAAPAGMAMPTQAPIASAVQVTNMQALGTTDVNVQNQGAVKAFVVERDITDSQDRISKIKAAATL
ncbi:hypothetical protein UFOVP384_54 [uncultured Caudovirales phage]|uniref:Uncharacterized protein n=1 Tax=uncultured Caudovirales phage TaxID=2100421 RepID=A0A6J7WZK4_9CAUD|nr:hypothetical protein UFOVP384_54 [uncultured Caudovirales phage]